MGIPLTIFSLYQLDGEGDAGPRHVLLRVRQPGFRNADASEYDAAFLEAEERRRALLAAHFGATLATTHLVGELQCVPAGDALDDAGGRELDLWVARTKYGAPWVVMGIAPTEPAFWRAVAADADLAALGGMRPARRVRAFFLADDD
jgi:hypothetical protein